MKITSDDAFSSVSEPYLLLGVELIFQLIINSQSSKLFSN